MSRRSNSRAIAHQNSAGFTLIELSIVLVIIGLVAGGVLYGKDLLTSAEIRHQLNEIEMYKSAMFAFKAKYDCTAGDCTKATQLGIGANGDGDGYICFYCGGRSSVEYLKVWKHLSAGGLLATDYTGSMAGGGFYGQLSGTNIPESKIGKGGVQYGASFFSSWSAHEFSIGARDAHGNYGGNFFLPALAREIDLKVDDGLPLTGKVRGDGFPLAYHYGTNFQTCRPNEGGNYYVVGGQQGPLCHLRFEFSPP